MRGFLPHTCLVLAGVVLTPCTPVARAQTPERPSAPPNPRDTAPPNPRHTVGSLVVIADPAARQDAQVAIRALRSQLSDTSLTIRVVWSKSAGESYRRLHARRLALKKGVVAVVRYSLQKEARITILLARSGRSQTRSVMGADLGTRAHSLALIVRSLLIAMLAEAHLQRKPVPPPRPVPRARPRPPATGPTVVRRVAKIPRRGRLGMELGYAVSGVSNHRGVGHGPFMSLAVNLPRGFSVFAGYQYSMVHFTEGDGLYFPWQFHPVHLGARWGFRWRRLEVGGSLALGVTIAALRDVPGVDIGDLVTRGYERYHVLWAAVPMVNLRFWISWRFALTLAVGTQIVFNPQEYFGILSSERGAAVAVDVSTWRVQPLAMLGIVAEVF